MTFKLQHALKWAEKRRKEELLGLPQYSLRTNQYADLLTDDQYKQLIVNKFGKHALAVGKKNARGVGL